MLYTCGPLLIIAALALPLLYAKARRLSSQTVEDLCQYAVSSGLFLVFLLYPTISQLVLSGLVCETIDRPHAPPMRFLKYDYRIDCDSELYKGFQLFTAECAF